VRLLLLSGTGGAGTSTIAQATALQAVADGARVQLIDLGNVREASVARASAAQWLSALAADILILRDSERVLPEELAILPGIDEFLALAAITECVTDPEIDFAVVDVGSLGQLARLLMTIDTLDRARFGIDDSDHGGCARRCRCPLESVASRAAADPRVPAEH
jgi:anion-transporting  ArsA/GET3 family ATPase